MDKKPSNFSDIIGRSIHQAEIDMDRLPSNLMFNIFSRMPLKCLARFRCVSKQWRDYIDDPYLGMIHAKRVVEEDTPIMFHHSKQPTGTLCFHIIESASTSHVLEPNKIPDLEFVLKKSSLSTSSSVDRVRIRGSCNGLLVICQDDCKVLTNMLVIHPLRKRCYELPPFPLGFDASMLRESCGLGFDASANTLKMVCVLLRQDVSPKNLDLVKKNLCTMVHVFDTNSWREISEVPPYPIEGEAVFADGCLHWLAGYYDRPIKDNGREVIWFDVRKEEFGLINPPPNSMRNDDPLVERKLSRFYDHLVDLNGRVGYVCNKTMEIWVLKHKEWVLHCRINDFLNRWLKVLGCWNKAGDILIKVTIEARDCFFVYNLISDGIHEANIVGRECKHSETGIIMYPNNLFSIQDGINTNSNSIRKKSVMKKKCLKD